MSHVSNLIDFKVLNSNILVFIPDKMGQTQEDIREALEKKVLTYMAASNYEAIPKLLVAERGISFTQLPPKQFDEEDPAASSCILVIDHEPDNPSTEKGNYLISDSKKDYSQLFDLLYDLTKMLVIKLSINCQSSAAPLIKIDKL